MKQTERRPSLPRMGIRFVSGLVIGTLLVINLGGWLFYDRARDYMEGLSEKRLITVAQAVAAQIDRDVILSFEPGDEETPVYAREREKLLRLRDQADLDHVFLFAPFFGSLLDSREEVGVGDHHPLADMDGESLQDLWLGEPAGLPVYEIDGERFQSAFVPLLRDGELRAVVGVDASAHFLSDLNILRNGLYITALLSLVLAGGLGLFVYRNARRLLDLQGEIKNAEKLAALGTLTAGLAHEVRNPLAIIRASAELLQEEDDSGGRREAGAEIIDEVDRLSDLLTHFLDFARPKDVELAPGDVGALVEGVLRRIEPGFLEKGIRIERRYSAGVPSVPMDTKRIEQAVLNLMINAREATPDGEAKVEVAVAMRRRVPHSAHLLADKTNGEGYVEVCIIDGGLGIAEDIRDRLFDPFFSTKEKGTGLGLSIVHGIVQSHGGYLFVESEPGKGTSIGFGLPA